MNITEYQLQKAQEQIIMLQQERAALEQEIDLIIKTTQSDRTVCRWGPPLLAFIAGVVLTLLLKI